MSGPSEHRQAYAYCAYCPKVCRFACPVSEATHSETVSTWAKMTEGYLRQAHDKRPSEESSKALYACTGCMRCRSFCKHENEVGYALFGARQTALETRTAPAAVVSTLATFQERQNPFGADLVRQAARFSNEGPSRYPLFPGCTALAKAPQVIEDALAVARRLSVPLALSKMSATCCGYPLYAAGQHEGFEKHARQMAKSLALYPELVVLDPGCAYTLKVVYERFGVSLKPRILTAYEIFAAHLDHVRDQPPLPVRAVFQDPCHLGRGLGQYSEPRKLLRSAVTQLVEARENQAEAGCSGGGGLLPRTWPEASNEISHRLGAELALRAELIVTGCPTSLRKLQHAGHPAEDLFSVLRRWAVPRT